MNNKIENLQTEIRRYCINNSSRWTEKYYELASNGTNRSGFGYTDEALYIFPRYMLLNAILVKVERYRPEDFPTLDEAKRFFRLVATETQSESTEPHDNKIERKAIDEERDAFCKFIEQLNKEDLSSVKPLFYRRVLSEEESNSIWEKLSLRWGIPEHYWYPLTIQKPENIEAFQDAYFDKEVSAEKLQEILRGRGVEKVWEIREYGANYELELSVFEPCYNGAEGYWCDENFDWIIYASHESSITIGGWLLSEIQAIWLNWKERIWTTPFFD
ncbi:MAG: hypothetical protein M3R14_08560 [Acidobacteriota bacterium]|nr:hypothetical protein [Acidobacteriota bacterium]